MKARLQNIAEKVHACTCGNKHYDNNTGTIEIGTGMLKQAALYIAKQSWHHVVMIADSYTHLAAGASLEHELKLNHIDCKVVILKQDGNGDVLANEVSIVQALLEIPLEADVILAVGSGTIHDITRFVSYKMGKPFVSIPTAASVDGFNSMGAPLIVRGFKITYQLHCPVALFADLDVLKKAPAGMRAAGLGDMICKYTSLLDWKFSHLMAGELYCPVSAELTREALDSCVQHVEDIAAGNDEGIRILMEALIISGLAMLIIGQSHPASGGEHHVSHSWEMVFLKEGRKQILHGAKVGVAAPLVAGLYKNGLSAYLKEEQELAEGADRELMEKLIANKEELLEAVMSLPEPARFKQLLAQVGGPTEPQALGLDEANVTQSLREAHLIRMSRYTILRFLNEQAS
jgi:glycerol-1-phosphate dehydrogenase [NAD(P)+]